MIYTEYQQVLLTQLQNNDKRIEEIKKEQEEIQSTYLQPIITQYFASNKSEIWP